MVLPRPLPTPVLAFADPGTSASEAGVMVTASHNPPQDNGYKVYLGDGAQIVPPDDAEIAARIDGGRRGGDVPAPTAGRPSTTGWWTPTWTSSPRWWPAGAPRDVRIAYTPCTASAATSCSPRCTGRGSRAPRVVAAQAEPDPDVPHRVVPQPRGARRDGPRPGRGRRASTPMSSSPTTPTPTAARSRYPRPRPPAGWRMLRGDEVGSCWPGDSPARRRARGRYR